MKSMTVEAVTEHMVFRIQLKEKGDIENRKYWFISTMTLKEISRNLDRQKTTEYYGIF